MFTLISTIPCSISFERGRISGNKPITDTGMFYIVPHQPEVRISRITVCVHLASGGTFLLLLVYGDPDGIKIDSVGTKDRNGQSKQRHRVFNLISCKQRNGFTSRIFYRVMHVFFFKYTHTYMEHRVYFDVFRRAWDLNRMARDQNRADFLTIMQLAVIFQHLALFSILVLVNAHTNYFDRLMANQKWASRVRFDVIVDMMILWIHGKGSCKIYVQQPWKRTTRMVMLFIMMHIIIIIIIISIIIIIIVTVIIIIITIIIIFISIPCLRFFRHNWVNVSMVYGCGVFLSMFG